MNQNVPVFRLHREGLVQLSEGGPVGRLQRPAGQHDPVDTLGTALGLV